jgi:hypothetical protein
MVDQLDLDFWQLKHTWISNLRKPKKQFGSVAMKPTMGGNKDGQNGLVQLYIFYGT